MSFFITVGRQRGYLLPPSVDEWLPSDYLAANAHPDHDTLATFRRRFLPKLEQLFVQVLLLAREMKLNEFGTIALNGTKIKARAEEWDAVE